MPRQANFLTENPILQAGDYAVQNMGQIAAQIKEAQRKAAVTNFLQNLGGLNQPRDFAKQRREADEVMKLSQMPQSTDPTTLAKYAIDSQQKMAMIQYNAMLDEQERQQQKEQYLNSNLGMVGFMNRDEQEAMQYAFPKLSAGYGASTHVGGLAGLAASILGKKGTTLDGAKNEYDTRVGISQMDGKPHLFRYNKDLGTLEDTGVEANEALGGKGSGTGNDKDVEKVDAGDNDILYYKLPAGKSPEDLQAWAQTEAKAHGNRFVSFSNAIPGKIGIIVRKPATAGSGSKDTPLDYMKFAFDLKKEKNDMAIQTAKDRTQAETTLRALNGLAATANSLGGSKGWDKVGAPITFGGNTYTMTPNQMLQFARDQYKATGEKWGFKPYEDPKKKK